MVMRIHSRIWVCVCCMLSHHNGECCEGHDANNGEEFRVDIHPDGQWYAGTDHYVTPAVWALWGHDEFQIFAGGEHAEGCPNGPDGPRGSDCDCERREWSTSDCEGCGSTFHGAREAFTVFYRD